MGISLLNMGVCLSSDSNLLSKADYVGPLFLIPGIVIAMSVTGQAFTPEQSIELRRYILNKRRDGGWGLYVPWDHVGES